MDSGPGFMQIFATGAVVCTAGTLAALAIVAYCTRPPPRQNKPIWSEEELAHRSAVREYEGRYFDELGAAKKEKGDAMLSVDELADLKGKSIEEETPVGVVKMEYNIDTGSFHYYTDARNIGYKILDTVARNFCLVYDCPQICAHYKDEFEKAKANVLAERDAAAAAEAEESSDDDDDARDESKTEQSSVFATFKTYNARAAKPEAKRPRIITENANQFSFKGTLEQHREDVEAEKKKIRAENPDLTFAAFKDKQV